MVAPNVMLKQETKFFDVARCLSLLLSDARPARRAVTWSH